MLQLNNVETYPRRNLLKSYQFFEDEESIELVENKYDDILSTHLGMIALHKNDRRHKKNDTKDEDLYVDFPFLLDQ